MCHIPMPGIGECRLEGAILVPERVPPCMIEVQVRAHHQVDIPRFKPCGPEGILQASGAPFILDSVDVLELLRFLVSDPGIHQDQVVGGLHQEAAQGEGNPMSVVGGDLFFPQRPWNNAEHGATIQPLEAGLKEVDLGASQGEGPDER